MSSSPCSLHGLASSPVCATHLSGHGGRAQPERRGAAPAAATAVSNNAGFQGLLHGLSPVLVSNIAQQDRWQGCCGCRPGQAGQTGQSMHKACIQQANNLHVSIQLSHSTHPSPTHHTLVHHGLPHPRRQRRQARQVRRVGHCCPGRRYAAPRRATRPRLLLLPRPHNVGCSCRLGLSCLLGGSSGRSLLFLPPLCRLGKSRQGQVEGFNVI